jgi:hypothetical protein
MNKITKAVRAGISSFILIAIILTGCSKAVLTPSSLPDYVPPSFYNGNLTNPVSLLLAYFAPGADPASYTRYDGRVYVFENQSLSKSQLENATEDYIWVGDIQCYFFVPGDGADLKANQKYDMVGVNQGVNGANPGCLLFTGCVFVPAGSVQLKPSPITLMPPAPAADAAEIYNAFVNDLQGSIKKYEGRTLDFRDVCVEKMTTIGEADAGNEYYVQTGMIKFHAAVSDVIFAVREGYEVDIVGTVTGMQHGYLNIDILDITVTDPPGGFIGDVGY